MKSIFSSHTLPDPLNVCPFCEVTYLESDVRTLGGNYSKDLCHALCRNCGRAMFYSFEQKPGSIIGLGLLTDCDTEDALRFIRAPKITLNEVLEAYEAIERV